MKFLKRFSFYFLDEANFASKWFQSWRQLCWLSGTEWKEIISVIGSVWYWHGMKNRNPKFLSFPFLTNVTILRVRFHVNKSYLRDEILTAISTCFLDIILHMIPVLI
jgi:hypothetical protein